MNIPTTVLTIGFERPDGTSTIRAFLDAQFAGAKVKASTLTTASAPKPIPGIEFYKGKAKPYRAYCETNGVKKYLGYFALEADAWHAATTEAVK